MVRSVQGTILKADSSPVVDKEVKFLLVSGFTADSLAIHTKETVMVKTDVNGFFSIDLLSGEGVTYLVTLPSLERFEFDLSDGVDPLDLVNVR